MQPRRHLPLRPLIGGDRSISGISLRGESSETPAVPASRILSSLRGETSDVHCEQPLRPPPPLSPPLDPSPIKWRPQRPGKPRLLRARSGRQGPEPQGPTAPTWLLAHWSWNRCGRRAPAAKTPRILYRGKSGSSSKMGRQGLGGAGAAGRSMQRSQSRSSLSASFEALAGYFPCMNSLEEEEGGETPLPP